MTAGMLVRLTDAVLKRGNVSVEWLDRTRVWGENRILAGGMDGGSSS
jgi:hypothetical protein